MKIQIDSREKSRADHAEEYYMDHRTSIEALPIGDYIFDDQVVFEYKTIPDLVSSIEGRRVHNQAIDQYEHFPYHFVIIAGTKEELTKYVDKLFWQGIGFNMEQYYGEIARLNTYTTVIQVSDEKEAFRMMETQAKKCLDNKTITKEFLVKMANPAHNFLRCNIKGLGDKTSQRIVDELNVKTLRDLLQLNREDLSHIKGVGAKTAKNIMEAIGK